jgi:hypothetical protein
MLCRINRGERLLGCARRFRPMYVANVGHPSDFLWPLQA